MVAEQAGLDQIQFSKIVPVSNIPPWLLTIPGIHFEMIIIKRLNIYIVVK